jgi:glycogen operon protein
MDCWEGYLLSGDGTNIAFDASIMRVAPGTPYPLGATWQGNGTNFALFSEYASSVELCLYDEPNSEYESARIRIKEHTDQVWHIFVPDLGPGQLYAYRVDGVYDPTQGHRFNPAKVLIDPYAKAICGDVKWSPEVFGYTIGSSEEDLSRDDRNDVAYVPKCAVIDPRFDWGNDRPPKIPLHMSVIYELHVKGFSQLWEELPEKLRGTYAGLGSPRSIEYLKGLGVSAVELLPVHQHVDEQHLIERGLSNYWGYNTIGFFAPDYRYCSGVGPERDQVNEFKQMVKNLHAAGIEVILDVVYNHTAEGNHLGPTLSFRGIDNFPYYRLVPDNLRYYMDYTGTGNTLHVVHPRVLQLVMDSLRYWVLDMHVDGFRFDLAPALARELHAMSKLSAFFDVIHQDPVLSQVKLIAEPWDVGEGGYQVGNFPVLWSEWNGKYRDTIRRFWKGDEGQIREVATRISGSSDLYQSSGKTPVASINLITAHDGFSLWDLVSYNDKHNEANGEENRDGHNDNNSWNCGVEGPTEDLEINALRGRQMRNFLTTLFLSEGVPMLTAGDEYGKTQRGNNNAYCQDNEISWLKWGRTEEENAMTEFVRRLTAFRRKHPVFRRPKFFQGRQIRGTNIKDIMWVNAAGQEMTEEEWLADHIRTLGVILSGSLKDVVDQDGRPMTDDTFLLLLNAHHDSVTFALPSEEEMEWELILDTNSELGFVEKSAVFVAGSSVDVAGRSMMVLMLRGTRDPHAESMAERLKRGPKRLASGIENTTVPEPRQETVRTEEQPASPEASPN